MEGRKKKTPKTHPSSGPVWGALCWQIDVIASAAAVSSTLQLKPARQMLSIHDTKNQLPTNHLKHADICRTYFTRMIKLRGILNRLQHEVNLLVN